MARRILAAVVLLVVLLAAGAPAPAGSQTRPHLAFLGDSMGAQAAPQIRNRLGDDYRLFLAARERAVTANLLPDIQARLQQVPGTQIVLIELGAGDANNRHGDLRMRRDIRRMLDAVRDVPCVRWFNLKIAGVNGFYEGYVDRADDFNRILAREIVDYPNARVAPYRQWSVQHPGAFKADGLHHTAQGKTRFAAFIQSVADNCPGP